ncbi:hypothetical protein BH18VER1_BH18VER1_09750 [soil metagenome]
MVPRHPATPLILRRRPLPAVELPRSSTLPKPPFAAMFRPMSGMCFEYPGVRFSQRLGALETIMRSIASLLIYWVTVAACQSVRRFFRPYAAEFPAATQSASKRLAWTSRGPRTAGGASIDALPLNYNSVNLEDHYGISINRETSPLARWLPQTGRRRPLLSTEHARQCAGQANILAEDHGALFARSASIECARQAGRRQRCEWQSSRTLTEQRLPEACGEDAQLT